VVLANGIEKIITTTVGGSSWMHTCFEKLTIIIITSGFYLEVLRK